MMKEPRTLAMTKWQRNQIVARYQIQAVAVSFSRGIRATLGGYK